MNESGAKKEEVNEAVRMIGDTPDPSILFERYAGIPVDWVRRSRITQGEPAVLLAGLPKEIRLALEMATHEDTERRALEGELAVLEEAWRDAEEIAKIADDMFVPEETRARLSALKARQLGGD